MSYQLNSDCASRSPSLLKTSIVDRLLDILKRLVANGLSHYRKKRQARIDRAAYQHVRLLSDETLDDIGVTRANVEWANQLPLHQSAAWALDRTKKRARPKIQP